MLFDNGFSIENNQLQYHPINPLSEKVILRVYW
jgi:hypothetical protein